MYEPIDNDYVYFSKCGYKCYPPKYMKFVVEGFQSHNWLKPDGLIGALTRKKMRNLKPKEYCPEVFEEIYGDSQIPHLGNNKEYIVKCLRYNLINEAEYFISASTMYDVSIFHIIAHAALEGDWGRSKIARDKKNLFGWAAYDSSAYDSALGFSSFGECIMEWTKWFRDTYLLQSGKYFCGNSEFGVNINYATSPVAGVNKAFIVRDLRKDVSAK